jgi:hypothetical protein
MKKKVDIKKQLEIFHKAGEFLGSRGISVLTLTSLGEDILISEAGFTFEEAIYLIRHLAETHPRELKLALDVVNSMEREQHQSTTVH